MLDDNYIEIDLKIKGPKGQDRELSKGILSIRGIIRRPLETCVLETESLETRLSTVDVVYALMVSAVEATVLVEVVQGEFSGRITAHTTSITDKLVLYDSKVAGPTSGDDHGAILLMRPVVCVHVKDKLIIHIKATGSNRAVRVSFTPKGNGTTLLRQLICLGDTKMRLKVAWSIMDP